jgi:thiamine kinase
MTDTLPRHIRLKLEQTLAQWPHWHCEPALTEAPTIVAVMTPGISNFSVLVASGQRFVVRIDGVNPAANGLNRQTEWRALEAARLAGLAPTPRYFNPELGSLVCDYLSPDENQALCIADVAALLRNIHQLPARHCRLDLAERMLRYEKQLAHRNPNQSPLLTDVRGPVLALLDSIIQQSHPVALCHNDLLQANRIYSAGQLWAIDWEYCAMGSPWYDIAVVVNGDSLSATQTDELLAAYLGRPATSAEQLTLHQYGCVYRYLEILWYQTQDKPGLQPAALASKLTALESALAQ